MMISGHKTRSVFDRYAVFNERDIRDAVDKMERHHQQKQTDTQVAATDRPSTSISLPN
jgi:hypothetical protein